MLTSIVIRTLNEQKHLGRLLASIAAQDRSTTEIETIIVDSGSTDGTLRIARSFTCRIAHIEKAEFSFGRSLNLGCGLAQGDVLTFISGHCVPVNNKWIGNLIAPIVRGTADYTYGRQIGDETTKFSERQIFQQHFPLRSAETKGEFSCNNANAALRRTVWQMNKFDEDLTGLEDLDLAKRLVAAGGSIGYVADAAVYHIHDEGWSRVMHRYEREALALQKIMPEVHIGLFDLLRYVSTGVLRDLGQARREGQAIEKLVEIVLFRCCQYFGTYRGNLEHRKFSQKAKERLFYPR